MEISEPIYSNDDKAHIRSNMGEESLRKSDGKIHLYPQKRTMGMPLLQKVTFLI